ncbi:MAG: UDP-N-acetylmuramate dehydrogenase, partial [Rhodospirillales bacterium]|nr:UDP-N-acetylmuramate dehydrogenase [Rhodospirillales bacterium]
MISSQRGPLIERLPPVRGRLSANAPLAQITWFRVGGPAEVLFKPADTEDLAAFLAEVPMDVPLTVIGVGSNLLVRDGGVPGVVIRLGGPFAEVKVTEETRIEAGAGALDLNVAITARDHGIAGLEFLSGVPGTIGGALRMNAGAYGREMKDVVVLAEAVDRRGGLHRLGLDDLRLSYRHCGLPKDWIFTATLLEGGSDTAAAIQERMDEIKRRREDTQPLRTRTGGSTFANPPGARAWELIDRAGCRGLTRGGAMVSEKHCNFLLNTGAASAADIEDLG